MGDAKAKNNLSMGRSTDYYRKNKKARVKKAATDKKINARPEQKAKRRALAKKRYHDAKAGKKIKGKDYDHGTNKYLPPSKNRGKTSGSPGDRRARGGGKRKEKK